MVKHLLSYRSLLLLVLLVCLASFAQAKGNAKIHDIRLWKAPDNTRIVFDLSKPVEHKIFTLSNPDRVVIDIPKAELTLDPAKVDLKDSDIVSIRSGSADDKSLRVVLDMSKGLKPKSFFLKKAGKADDRLVVDLKEGGAEDTIAKKSAHEIGNEKRDLIIAIDAGHGGEDPGAIGPNKVYEKHVVMAIAKELAYLFKKEKGYSPVLIRTGDYYVGLGKRRDLARQANADMFVSIHADAFKSPQAHGSSVYSLSHRGSTSAAAQFLADKENQADLVGGVSLSDKDEVLSSILVDLSMTHKMESSLDVGASVLQEMGGISRLHSRRVEQAAFAVLKTPDIPSILVETGFISNPGEAKKLNTKSYQRKMARAIFNGIGDYFSRRAPEDTYVAWKNKSKNKEATYVVARGDTLSGIASRYAISTSQLQSHNSLNSSSIRIGQKLRIPLAN